MLTSFARSEGHAPAGVAPLAPGFEEGGAGRVLVKCMGRTYATTVATTPATAERITFSDVTDITRPLPLGAAVRSDDALWAVHAPDGRALLHTGDLLSAVVALREDYISSARP
ncbi:hypothetical protein [Kitasatospora mediocidica]|uniref:hypothetical protein n=1 Tax=Kitasatospora mediocidica TaxID=58352 RepID=UPI00056A3E66|nr:hypothetical protein [Kitasatospora mediocidica]